ncbi:hypothetical protein PPL_09229 [Heterostelium album PN500]|uniref:Uncharacterized protein n=1 Tax=Heterostelium pallidum (strain ATCC 26659 / Pp 5 / PN500) TaxID=670386 RepID=D3BKZ7_HETP5|nr:hypothetical protein PPL_09229 [Heterostelium album PN500]EFA78577.1 hypothetical protein PPL_09229 [Heterostelium album PN500]|eukprot:XP_020430701.1 hypothetical protein PPL_09229 [Heterostelium album PN500]
MSQQQQQPKTTIRESRDMLISLFPECEKQIKDDVNCYIKFGPNPESLQVNCNKENWECTFCLSLCDAAQPLKKCMQTNNYQTSACQPEINNFLAECRPETMRDRIEKRANLKN